MYRKYTRCAAQTAHTHARSGRRGAAPAGTGAAPARHRRGAARRPRPARDRYHHNERDAHLFVSPLYRYT